MHLSHNEPEPQMTKTYDQLATENDAARLALQFLLARIRARLVEDERIPVRGMEVVEGEHLNLWDAS